MQLDQQPVHQDTKHSSIIIKKKKKTMNIKVINFKILNIQQPILDRLSSSTHVPSCVVQSVPTTALDVDVYQ